MKRSSKNKGILRKLGVIMMSLLMCTVFIPSFAFAEGPDEPAVSDDGEVIVDETAAETETEAAGEEVVEPETDPAGGTEAEPETEAGPETEAEQEAGAETEAEPTPGADFGEEDPGWPELVIDANEGVTVSDFAPVDTYRTSAGDYPQGVTVEAAKSSIFIHINKVGASGTAQLFRYNAEEYFSADPYKGQIKEGSAGVEVAEYELGTYADIECPRYTSDGADHLYDKYYLIRSGSIVAGPFYASEIASINGKNEQPFDVVTKKGLTLEDETTITQGLDMGIGNTVINWDLCSMIYRNEDAYGNPVDNSGRNCIKFKSNGEWFYFDADYIHSQDGLISAYTKNNINVSLVVISWVQCLTGSYPQALRYNTNNSDRQTMAFNTSNELGRKYLIAAFEFMAKRYSDKDKYFVDQYIIGNEIDYTYDWCLIQPLKNSAGAYQKADFDVFMEEFARGFRLANLAIKKYNTGSKVLLSLTHNWAENCYTSYGWGPDTDSTSTQSIRVNSYAPKKIFDWLTRVEGARGDFNWGLSVHPYPIGTTSSNPVKTDFAPPGAAHPINGNPDTSPWITAANLELYQLYLEREANLCNGEIRTVSITEGSICNVGKSAATPEEYQKSLNEQAASIAQYYYRAACLPCVNEIAYFEYHDQDLGGQYNLGLAEVDGTEKPSLNVWKYIDTNKSFAYSNRFLKYIDPNLKDYLEVMDASGAGFDWEKYWTPEILMPRDIGDSSTELTVSTDKTSYGPDEAITVTATGNEGDRVCLYKAGENISNVNPIYEYPVVGSKNNQTFYSGEGYNILAYGSINGSRYEEAKLKAGDYMVVVIPADDSEPAACFITLTGDYTYGQSKHAITTDKTTYKRGEPIIVSAWGEGTSAWAGIYTKGATPGVGGTSIYWYYCNDEGNGQFNGRPTIIQTKTHENGTLNEPGQYVVYLFRDGGYSVVDQVEITIEELTGIAPVVSLDYKLDVEDDGFANGVVTVKKRPTDYMTTDCVMFWADETGKPLEGWGSLAMFKLTGETTTYRMHPYTIIPEGAKKLIAYGANGSTSLSDEYVSVDLPEGCTYKIEGDVLAEFQMLSDVHVTTDAGATGEVTHSNEHFAMMLKDVMELSPDSLGIFINGDIANTGSSAEYEKVLELYDKALAEGDGELPYIHMSIGNHDWIQGNPSNQFQRYVYKMNPTLEKQPEKVYYDEVVGGYHFVYLGGEQAGLHAKLSQEQLDWFDGVMQKCTEEDPDKPVFVLLHQSFYNTVSGSLPGQGWHGIDNEESLKEVMEKYGQIIFFNGHSHWELNSLSCAFGGNEDTPAALNTAAVGYLWSSYNITPGEFWEGSQGYFVRVYDDKVIFFGREFEHGVFLPSGTFVIQRDSITTDADEYTLSLNSSALDLNAESETGGPISYISENESIVDVLEDGTVVVKGPGDARIRMKTAASNTHVIGQKLITIHVSDEGVYRVFGSNRYETSLKVADAFKEKLGVEQFDAVILADGRNYADALAGSYLSYVRKAPILLVGPGSNHVSALQDYIKANLKKGGQIYMLGGSAVVPDSAVAGLSGYMTRRLGRKNRYDTNLLILKEAARYDDGTFNDVIVCTGTNFADSLSASATGRPILLVNKALTEDQIKYLASNRGKDFYIVGGTGAVSADIEEAVKKYGDTTRIGGNNRYETSVGVAEKLFDDPAAGVVAYGKNFPDGLCGGALAYSIGAPLILAANGNVDVAAEYAKDAGVVYGAVLGGTTLIDDASAKKIFGLAANAEIPVK